MELLFSFKGKIGRGRFLGVSIIYLFAFLLIVNNMPDIIGGLALLFYIFINLALASKRLRDIGRSPWLTMLYLFPPAGVILFVMLVFIKGKYGQIKTSVTGARTHINRIDFGKKVETLEELQENVFRIMEDSIG